MPFAYATIKSAKSAAFLYSKKYKVYRINEGGQKVEIPGLMIEGRTSPLTYQSLNFQVGGHEYFGAYNTLNGELVYEPNWNEILEQAKNIDNLTTSLAPSSYREIINNHTWLSIYKPTVYERQTWNWETNTIETVKSENLFACRHCGVILEKEQIEIDHQRSKTAGVKTVIPEHNRWGATLKLFRYSNLTAGGAMGFKANKLNLGGMSNSSLEKYQLNDNGIFIFSLFLGTKTDIEIQREAETAIPNLRPLCGGCNKRDGEPSTGLPWNKQ